MLDPRIYRMGLIPVVLAVIVLAFSLGDQPAPLTTTLAPDAYSGQNAYATMSTLATPNGILSTADISATERQSRQKPRIAWHSGLRTERSRAS